MAGAQLSAAPGTPAAACARSLQSFEPREAVSSFPDTLCLFAGQSRLYAAAANDTPKPVDEGTRLMLIKRAIKPQQSGRKRFRQEWVRQAFIKVILTHFAAAMTVKTHNNSTYYWQAEARTRKRNDSRNRQERDRERVARWRANKERWAGAVLLDKPLASTNNITVESRQS